MEFIPELRDVTLLPLAGATAHNRENPGRVVEVRKGQRSSTRGNSEEEHTQEADGRRVNLAQSQGAPEASERTPLEVGSIPMSLVQTYTSGGRMHSERLDFAARTIVSGDEAEAARDAAKGLRSYVKGFEFRFRTDFDAPTDPAGANWKPSDEP